MSKYISLGNLNVTADVSYSNVLDRYMVGLHIGNIYTILDDKFNSEKEAKDYIFNRFY